MSNMDRAQLLINNLTNGGTVVRDHIVEVITELITELGQRTAEVAWSLHQVQVLNNELRTVRAAQSTEFAAEPATIVTTAHGVDQIMSSGATLMESAFLKYSKLAHLHASVPPQNSNDASAKLLDLSGFLRIVQETKIADLLSSAFLQRIFQVVKSNRHPDGLRASQRSSDRASIALPEFAVCLNIALTAALSSTGAAVHTGLIVLQRLVSSFKIESTEDQMRFTIATAEAQRRMAVQLQSAAQACQQDVEAEINSLKAQLKEEAECRAVDVPLEIPEGAKSTDSRRGAQEEASPPQQTQALVAPQLKGCTDDNAAVAENETTEWAASSSNKLTMDTALLLNSPQPNITSFSSPGCRPG